MSKNKDQIKELRDKLFESKLVEEVKKATQTIEDTLPYTTFDLIQDPNTSSRSFIALKIKYNPETKQAAVVETFPFPDKTTGLSIVMDKENRKYIFEKYGSKK